MKWQLTAVLAATIVVSAGPIRAEPPELAIADKDFEKLDTFEGHVLAKADRIFAEKDYRRAAAEYDAFLLQYPKSVATAYAVYRKARSLHLDHKRYEAIKGYTEVLDYFPNQTSYAGAALYYMGLCHLENGDVREALKAWSEMAADVDYRKHVLAAGAINQLADNLVKDKPAMAAEHYKQVAVDFRRANPEAARYAIEKAVGYYVRTQPDEPRLHEFYIKAETFDPNPAKPDETNYWIGLRGNIRTYGSFQDGEKEQRNQFYRYWAGAMEGKFPQWDDFQTDLAGFKLAYEGDTNKWAERLDRQFAQYQKPDDFGRVIKWISLFGGEKKKVQDYYAKLDFAKMSAPQVQRLVRVAYDHVHDAEMAKNTFAKIRLESLSDEAKYDFERYLWYKDGKLVSDVCLSMTDKNTGRMELLRYFHWSGQPAQGIPLADEMAGVPQHAKEAYWLKAEMLRAQQKLPEAIAAYQSADNPPHNLWRIADCYLAQGKREHALAQLREIENFFKDQAPEAALRIASIYRDSGEKAQYIASLRGILKKYPKSAQSSASHLELEKMGIKIGGGVDAD